MRNGSTKFRESHRTRTATRLMGGAALGAIAFLSTAPAFADSGIETVVVTAERRATDLQKTPIAATVLTGADLKARNINSLDALQFNTPSLAVQDSGQNVLLNIRGIGKSDGGAQDSVGVITYRDGVTTGYNGFVADEPYYDISNIQVLRGPQGTFAGQNATGGAILITETDPDFDGVSGFAEGQYGSYNDVRLQAAINIPLTDDLAIRIATDDENRDSWYHMSFNPADNFGLAGHFTGNAGNLHTANGRISVLWQPTQKFTAELKLDGNYIDHGAPLGAPYDGPTAHIFDISSDAHLMGIDQQIRGVLHMNYEFDNGITLKSISSEQLGVVKFNLDGDGTDSAFAVSATNFGPQQAGSIGKAEVMSQEFDLVSPDTGRFTWVLGAVWLDEQIFVPRLYVSALPGGTLTSGDILAATHGFYREDNWGIFGQGIYALTDALKLQVGLRYSSSFENFNAGEALFIDGVEDTIFPAPINVRGHTQDSKVTGKVDLDYQVDENNFLYAFAATGHKAAGLNGDGTKYKGEDVTDYEVGWKAKFFDDHVQTQIGGYYDDYYNFVMSFFDPHTALGTGGGEDENVTGTTVTKGVEAQVQAVFGGLSLNFGVSHEDSAIGSFVALDQRNPGAGFQNLTGRQLPNAPPWTAQAGVQYTFDLGDEQTLTPRLDYGLTSAQWGSVFQLPGGNPFLADDRLAARNLFNGLITYNTGKWQVALYGTNIFNLHYVATELYNNLGFPGDPQQFGVRVTKAF